MNRKKEGNKHISYILYLSYIICIIEQNVWPSPKSKSNEMNIKTNHLHIGLIKLRWQQNIHSCRCSSLFKLKISLLQGHEIISEGDLIADYFYICQSGTFEIFVTDSKKVSDGRGHGSLPFGWACLECSRCNYEIRDRFGYPMLFSCCPMVVPWKSGG